MADMYKTDGHSPILTVSRLIRGEQLVEGGGARLSTLNSALLSPAAVIPRLFEPHHKRGDNIIYANTQYTANCLESLQIMAVMGHRCERSNWALSLQEGRLISSYQTPLLPCLPIDKTDPVSICATPPSGPSTKTIKRI